MLNILLISYKFSPNVGGIESISQMLADEFIEKGYKVKILTTSKSVEEDEGFGFEVIRNPNIVKLFKVFYWSDIILENNPSLKIAWPSIFFLKKRIVGLQTWLPLKKKYFDVKWRLKQKWIQSAYLIIACSKAISKSIDFRSVIVHNPFNSRIFKRFPNIEKTKDFVFVGRLVSDKGADIALKAFLKFSHYYPTSTLTIIGEGPEISNLKSLALKLDILDKIYFTGVLKGQDLVISLNQYKYQLIPSTWEEPFGIVALEGIACGCVPIVADSGGLPEAIGEAGLVFKKNDINDLFLKMKTLKENYELYTFLLDKGKLHILDFRCSTVADKYISLF